MPVMQEHLPANGVTAVVKNRTMNLLGVRKVNRVAIR
jgi:hypothetical protein